MPSVAAAAADGAQVSLERYARWLARGREHQTRGSVIDALLCYRRALREVSAGVDARFHLGEIAWHLGNQVDAIAAWQSAIELSERHLPSLHALADALAATGRFEGASAAAGRVLALQPDEPRAIALTRLARMAIGEPVDDSTLAHAVQSNSQWPIALLAAAGVRMLERASAYPAALPLLLDQAAVAATTIATEDALRALALAAAEARLPDRADAFARRYAQSCQALHAPTMPLLWPLRTAGNAVRAGLIVTDDGWFDAAEILAELERGLGNRFRATVFVASVTGSMPAAGAREVRALPADAEAAARAMAALDLDVLLDFAGLRAPTGPLLARRPARALWAIAHGDVPAGNRLADHTFAVDPARDAATLVAALEALHAQALLRPASPLGAAGLAKLWEDAVHAHQRGDPAASALYARVLEAQPDSASALYLTGVLARADDDVATARARLRAALEAAPDFVDARAALADLETAAGDAAAGATIARQGLERSAVHAVLWRALGQAALKQRDARAAASAFAEALKRDPAHGETHYNRGVALQMAREPAEAARAYQRALAFRPDLHAADFNLGVIFDQQGNAGAAIAAFSKVLERAPAHARAYKALAETLLASGRIEAWFANFERFERSCPNHLALAAHALEVCAYRADFARLAHYLDGLRSGRFTEGEPVEILDALQQLLYLLHFFDVEPELIGRHARTHDAMARRLYGEPRPRRTPRQPGKLRIGYLSGDFRNHVMGKMMWEALRHHDRDRFAVYGYATGDARDEWTDRYASLFDRLAPLDALTDADAARRIAGDDLDVLIDLSTHTKGARPGILAQKPARVQITHVASAGTLAMSAIDFKLTDRHADVSIDPQMQIEAPLVMDGCVYPYRHVAPAPAGFYTRERVGIPPRAVVIGAFVTPLKLSQRCLALWRDVMQRVPDAVLAFSPLHPSLRTVFQRICAAGGIDAHRIAFVLQGRDDAENQARYGLVDFVLDPLPYGGVNGTLEALDMRVPVVTLVGHRHAERTSYSILMNLGITDTIAETGGDYVDIALRLATDPPYARELRARIGSALAHSALTDMPAHARNLERAYVDALAERAPEALDDVR